MFVLLTPYYSLQFIIIVLIVYHIIIFLLCLTISVTRYLFMCICNRVITGQQNMKWFGF